MSTSVDAYPLSTFQACGPSRDAFRELSVLAAHDARLAVQRFLGLAIEPYPSVGSAGLSEIEEENGEALFRWTALSGEFHAPIVEELIVPLYDTDQAPIATLWVVSHSNEVRGFDVTGARLLERLAARLLLSLKPQRLNRQMKQLLAPTGD